MTDRDELHPTTAVDTLSRPGGGSPWPIPDLTTEAAPLAHRPRLHADGPSRPRRRWPRVGIVVVTLALLTGALVVGSNAHRALGHTDASLAATGTQLHRTLARLTRARAALTSVTGAAHSAAVTLGSDESQLSTIQGQLATAQADQLSQGVDIADLDQCLSGVERALNQVSLGAPGAAVSTLNSVAATCRAAQAAG